MFGLLTAINIDDVPKILRRVAQGYRGTKTTKHQDVWYVVADEIDQFADKLAKIIEEAKKGEKRSARIRL